MKKIITKSLFVLGVLIMNHYQINAQGQIFDVVSIGPGYTNQSFYSLSNGEISNELNTNWDLAFQISGFQATILINSKNNVRLFKSGIDINSWSSITANDTTGVLNAANELYNQDTSWWAGAFNVTNDVSNQFDLGWGIYDLATHVVTGDSLFFLKLSTGVVKKLWIQSLQNNTYFFAYADLDGTNEVYATLNKQSFQGKNFGYYSIIDGMELDREPNKYLWDLTFAQYMATTPFVYKVSGVLSNDSIQAVKAYPVDVATVTPWGYNFSFYINTIGNNWKAFDFNSNAWSIEDSLAYFIYDRGGLLWKVVFTGFGGASNGNYEFYKEQISATGLIENGGQPALLSVYPNPASAALNLVCFIKESNSANTAGIYDINGKLVMNVGLSNYSGLNEIRVNTESLNEGVYVLKVSVDHITTSSRIVIVK
ncbi:MAG: T9SS type A sorting domain-containing protein [Bacteroidota bacterium]|nr:T9SS type A sorting domain-containing protein [Bacteroidota bacterium]